MADQLDFVKVQILDANAAPGAGYVARFYESGTTSPVTVYADAAATDTPLGTSITADASGKFMPVFHPGGIAIKAVTEDANGAIVETVDPVRVFPSEASGAENITFTPTVELPFTNVQDAIVGAATSAASGFGPFGLGVTGNAGLIANLDATNVGSGAYRFDGTTTGTFPTGVVAADTGIIETWRETSGSAIMFLYHDTTDKAFFRRMASSSWGTWREVLTANQGFAAGDTVYHNGTNLLRLAKGTAAQKFQMNAGATAPEWFGGSSGLILTTSGTSIASGAIPAGARRLRMYMIGVSINNSTSLLLRIGPSGGLATTGYVSDAGNRTGENADTTGFIIANGGNTWSNTGFVDLGLADSATNLWIATHVLGISGISVSYGGGRVALAGGLTQAALTTVGAAGTFDAGSIAFEWS